LPADLWRQYIHMLDIFNFDPEPWSRNADDEECDEDANFVPSKPLEFKKESTWGHNDKLDVEVLVVGMGIGPSCFLHAHFTTKTKMAQIIIPEIPLPKKQSDDVHLEDKTCILYRLLDSILLVTCHYCVSPERSYDWKQILFQYVQPKRVVVLSTMSPCEYKGENERSHAPHLRKIETEEASRHHNSDLAEVCKNLEPLNIVDKAPAAIITHCQLHNIPAELYLSLEEPRALEIETLVAFEPTLRSIVQSFQFSDKRTVSYKKFLCTVRPKKHIDLYL